VWLCAQLPDRFVVDRRLARLVQDETLVEIDVSHIAGGWEVREFIILDQESCLWLSGCPYRHEALNKGLRID
jgi:hypothetical protein